MPRHLDERSIVVVQNVELLLAQVFDVDQPVRGAGDGRHQLVQLELHRARVLVLRVLDQEHHEERHDGRSRVDDELPGVGKVKERAGQEPHDDDPERDSEGLAPARPLRGLAGEVLPSAAKIDAHQNPHSSPSRAENPAAGK